MVHIKFFAFLRSRESWIKILIIFKNQNKPFHVCFSGDRRLGGVWRLGWARLAVGAISFEESSKESCFVGGPGCDFDGLALPFKIAFSFFGKFFSWLWLGGLAFVATMRLTDIFVCLVALGRLG